MTANSKTAERQPDEKMVKVPSKVHRRLKIRAAKEGKSIGKVVEELEAAAKTNK